MLIEGLADVLVGGFLRRIVRVIGMLLGG